ncbi:MAG TPA: BadF/BadG/BcrA/BcrD ATPase family protein [Trueperaceae bacterium]|nr:BadF/BadG/BcrA/BcrD ATPase family protein [Trueperaceae bacterium]
MTVYVGVDGGGSKTRVAAADDGGRSLLDITLDGCDLPARGEAQVRRVLGEVRAAVAALVRGEPAGAAVRIALGLPAYGETRRWDEALDRLAADAFPGWHYRAYNDVRLALEGALPERPGVLVLCGTGSMAWGKSRSGEEARSGGWGPIFGDEGSGFDLGMHALRAACRVEDGRGPDTRLHRDVLRALGVEDVHGVLAALSDTPGIPRARVAGLGKVVVDAAEAGDAEAARLLADAARELVDLVEALVSRLSLDPDAAVSTAGGMFRGRAFAGAFARELAARGHSAPEPPRHPPAAGGVLLAGLPAGRLAGAYRE